MKQYEYYVNRFKQHLSEMNVHFEIRELILESNNCFDDFYDLCSDFSHVSINAQKIVNEDMSVGCYPDEFDIACVVENTKHFVNEYRITDINALLEIVYEMHSYAIKEDDIKKRNGYVKSDCQNSMLFGKLFNFSKLPDATWRAIKNRIVSTN